MKRTIMGLFIFICGLCNISADGDGNCPIEGFPFAGDVNFIQLGSITDVESLNLQYPINGMLKVQDDEFAKYLEVTTKNNNLIIKTTLEFANIETDFAEDEPTSYLSITRRTELFCDEGSSIFVFNVIVTDTDNNNTFGNSSYEYTVPMPMMPKYDLTMFGNPIIVTDLDFSNQNIQFEIQPSEVFKVEVEYLGKKQYRAILKANQCATFDQETTFSIVANDDGKLHGTTLLTIRPNVDSSCAPEMLIKRYT